MVNSNIFMLSNVRDIVVNCLVFVTTTITSQSFLSFVILNFLLFFSLVLPIFLSKN